MFDSNRILRAFSIIALISLAVVMSAVSTPKPPGSGAWFFDTLPPRKTLSA
jgi:hypothetical protein